MRGSGVLNMAGKAIAACAAFLAAAAFGDLTPKAWTGGGGNWNDPDMWSPAGVPTADDAVTIPSGCAYADGDASVKSLVVAAGAKLFFGGTGEDVLAAVPADAVTPETRTLSVAEDFTVNGQVAVGGLDAAGKFALAVGGGLSLGANAKLAVYAGFAATNDANPQAYVEDGAMVSVGGDLATATGSRICPFAHSVNGGTVRFTVAGDVAIAADSGFDADVKGWAYPHGFGCFHPGLDNSYHEGEGGSYGGVGGTYKGDKRTHGGVYGMACAPFWPGSPSENWSDAYSQTLGRCGTGVNGGGCIRIHAGGMFTLDGFLFARGGRIEGDARGGSSGGAVWITCDVFLCGRDARISVRGGDGPKGWGSGGGGGRVCIVHGAPSAEQIASLYATGEAPGLVVTVADVNDAVEYDSPDLIDLSPGSGTSYSSPAAEKGTGVILLNSLGKRLLNTAIIPSSSSILAPQSDPMPGQSAVSGDVVARAISPQFVPDADSRQRRVCMGGVYSNSASTASVAFDGAAYEFASSSAVEHWITWDFTRLQHLLRVDVAHGSGTVEGVGDWHDAGTTVTLTAVPEEGYAFMSWGGNLPTEDARKNPVTLEMSVPRDVVAVFMPVGFSGRSFSAAKTGDWFDAATWGGAGVPGPGDDVVIAGKLVNVTKPVNFGVKSLTLSGTAQLVLYANGELRNWLTPCTGHGFGDQSISFDVAGDLTMSGSSTLGVALLDASYRTHLRVGGDVRLSGSAKIDVYAGGAAVHGDWRVFPGDGAALAVGGNLVLDGTDAWIYPHAHTTFGDTVRIAVAKDATIASGCGIDADKAGWRLPNGFGYFLEGKVEGSGGWYGGHGGYYSAASSPGDRTYGWPLAPFWPGSPGEKGSPSANAGGGCVRLHVGGTLSLDGKITAAGAAPTSKDGGGSGGGVFVTCRAFKPGAGASVSVKGGNCTAGWAAGGGGGRFALLTGKFTEKDLAALYETGACPCTSIVCGDLADDATSPWSGLVNAAEGASSGTAAVTATRGTAMWARRTSGTRIILK